MELTEIENMTMPHKATPAMLDAMQVLRQNATRFFAVLDELVPDGREKDQARVNFEQMLMWANKSITADGELAEELNKPSLDHSEIEAKLRNEEMFREAARRIESQPAFDLKRELGQR